MDKLLQSFNLKKTLNTDIWVNTDSVIDDIKLNSEIRQDLLKIAKEFIDSFELPQIEIEDILLVGSLANYNWSVYSDLDLHVVIDKSKLDSNAEIVKQLFDAKKQIFNLKHNIIIKGYDVELYGQDINEPLEADGVYSVLFKKWINKPSAQPKQFDKTKIITKVKEFYGKLQDIKVMEDSHKKIKAIETLKDKIRKYRKNGLKTKGEFSTENLVFKYLRRSGYMDELSDLVFNIKDSIYSIDEVNF